ncbi:restriction endonuclease subunit S [Ornithinicoccus hortensis]|uniref:Type I restriction enzyme S subunit n=1 Tax=Ornithinicoccus hortensis TaxID=82346 RepID=A0A542YSR5_9MICO|nr:restriction endonuclease subunit S [Ornithinicoccus hortensis]TQL51139.1 type I restriction enzyme S subunit [Ornithinicoccus hortensis]
MSRIDNLIQELCPDGVEFAELQAVFTTKGGYTPSKNDPTAWADGTVPWFRMEDIRDNGRVLGSSLQQINESAVKGGRLFPANSILVATSATIGEHALITVPHLSNQRFTSLTLKPEFVDRFEIKFVFYYCFVLNEWCRNNTTTSSFASVDMSGFKQFKFPVPPLEVQREIVRVLDKFTQLEAELEAELEARRAQYDYYAGELLTIDEGVRRVRIGDVATIVRGASPRPIQKFITSDPEGVPWIKIGDVPADGKYITSTAQRVTIEGAAKSRRVLPGDFVLSNSMSFGRPYVSQIEGCIHDGWLAISAFEDSFERDYLYYLLRSTPVQEEFARRAGAGTVKNLNADIVRSVVIPVPPRAEQKRVIDLLDHFDALVNDIRIGLPAELAVRRKQYEYYRDRLLTFKETV